MVSISEKRKRVLQIITQHADVMTGPQLDKALDVWDRLVKSEINQPLPVAPNREKGKWAAKSDAINDRNTSETQPKTDGKKDDRPVNRMHWKVKHPDGRVFSYTMHPNGSMKVSLVGAQQTKTYTLAEWAVLHHAGVAHQENEANNQDNKKEKTTMEPITKSQFETAERELDKTANTKPDFLLTGFERVKARAAAYDRAMSNAPAPQKPVEPIPKKDWFPRSTEVLNGHQIAAQKCGLDVNTPGLEKMDLDQMRALVQQQNIEATRPMRQRLGIPEPLQDATKKVYPGFC